MTFSFAAGLPGVDGSIPGGPALGVTVDDGIVVVTIGGCLDAAVGRAFHAVVQRAVAEDARRLDIDLRQVTSFTAEGATALRACRPRAAGLREGLHYRTGRGPGRQALLAAYVPAPEAG